jgi:ubiquinone/menaquinone biosynthesis C-methylase UbiE
MLSNYEEYTKLALENYANKNAANRYLLVDAVNDLKVEKVLDVGCGAGQEIFPFLEKTEAFCVGVDVAKELGKVTAENFSKEKKASFVRSEGENLPFADASFDVVLCRVALPYMNNRLAIAEVARILKTGGIFLLKTHAPAFYFGMLAERLKTFNVKQIAYPLICLTASLWHLLTGKQLQKGFWQGKEIFQTRRFLEKEFKRNGLEIKGFLADNNPQTPSYLIVKK